MFGRPIPLFRLFGFAIRLDPSWFVLAILVAWSLATQVFPFESPGFSSTTYWLMGAGGTIGLFVSIVVHEFFHAIVARRYDIHIRGITLFIFGGVAEMENEPPSAKSEFLMAAAGPLASLGIAVLGFAALALDLDGPAPLRAVVDYLASINIVLVIFNCVPAFPLDGGRMLRAVLWHRRGDLRAATRTASRLGSLFGLLLIGFGVWLIVTMQVITGIWMALIGLFVRSVASASYQQLLLRDALAGEPVRRFMHRDPVRVPPNITLQTLVDDYVYRHPHKLYPIADDGHLVGCISIDQVKAIPRPEWGSRTVGEVGASCTPAVTVHPDADALTALGKMRRSNLSRLLVVDGEELVGILTLRDLLEFFALKVDLEG